MISLTVAFEDLAQHVVMVELDKQVSALWKTMLSDENDWLAERVMSFDMTTDNLRAELLRKPNSTRMSGFHTLLRNRTCHGGILAAGSGVIKYGENGKGIKSRWYPVTLCKRIQSIKFVQHKITFREEDGIATIKQHAKDANAVFFIDPPYTAAGKRAGTRLYTHYQLNHENLFDECSKIKGKFLMTYDVADEVLDMAKARNFEVAKVSMMNTHHSTMQELIIGRDLSWLTNR